MEICLLFDLPAGLQVRSVARFSELSTGIDLLRTAWSTTLYLSLMHSTCKKVWVSACTWCLVEVEHQRMAESFWRAWQREIELECIYVYAWHKGGQFRDIQREMRERKYLCSFQVAWSIANSYNMTTLSLFHNKWGGCGEGYIHIWKCMANLCHSFHSICTHNLHAISTWFTTAAAYYEISDWDCLPDAFFKWRGVQMISKMLSRFQQMYLLYQGSRSHLTIFKENEKGREWDPHNKILVSYKKLIQVTASSSGTRQTQSSN